MLKWLFLLTVIGLVLGEYKAAPYPSWAHSHWVWENGASQSQASLTAMVDGYTRRGIPVGALNIDSDWSTAQNDFLWNNTKFPSPKSLIDRMHQQNIKVIAWATSIINNNSKTYAEGKEKGYFLNQGQLIKWWHGHGSFLDYRNKEGVEWWHRQLDPVLALGLDGWKCDGADPLLIRLTPWPYSAKKKNLVRYREYANHYYGDFYNYTKSKRPDSLIMARPVDNLLAKYFFSYAPKYMMFAGWVGDQHGSYQGMRIALRNMFHSAWKNYLNFGLDIGGYGNDQTFTKEIFLRYVQLGSMLPLMENGGNGKHFPWLFDDENTIDVYRKYAVLHTSLTPFFLTAGTEAFAKGVSVMKPLATKQGAYAPNDPDSWGYTLWKDMLVYPILNDAGISEIDFPKGDSWVYYFNHSKIFKGDSNITAMFPLDEFPIFIRKGAMIPFHGKYLLVHPEGKAIRTIYHGDWSDEMSYERDGAGLGMKVERFYKPTFEGPAEHHVLVEVVGAKWVNELPSEVTFVSLEKGVLTVKVELGCSVHLPMLFAEPQPASTWN